MVRVHNQALPKEREKSDLQVNPMECLKHDLATPNRMVVGSQAPGKVDEGNGEKRKRRKCLDPSCCRNALPLHG